MTSEKNEQCQECGVTGMHTFHCPTEGRAVGLMPAPQSAQDGEAVAVLLANCLKPDEISGEGRPARLRELVSWFARFASGHANPKWLRGHAFELAYAAATSAPTVEALLAELADAHAQRKMEKKLAADAGLVAGRQSHEISRLRNELAASQQRVRELEGADSDRMDAGKIMTEVEKFGQALCSYVRSGDSAKMDEASRIYDGIAAVLNAFPAPAASAERVAEFTGKEVERLRQLFDCVADCNPCYLDKADYIIGVKLYEKAGVRVPHRMIERAAIAKQENKND